MHHFQQQHWVATCKSRNADPTAILSRTHVQAVPENQRREAIFKGLCIARKWRGWRSTFTVRNFITGGGGIERTFQLYVSIRPATSCCSTAGNQCRVAGVFLLNVPLQRARCMVHQISSLFCPSRCMHTGFQSAGLGWVGLACAHTSLKNLRSLSQPHVCQELSSAKSIRAMGACMHCYVIGPHPGLAVIPRTLLPLDNYFKHASQVHLGQSFQLPCRCPLPAKPVHSKLAIQVHMQVKDSILSQAVCGWCAAV